MAIDFDGSDDYIDCGSSAGLDNIPTRTVSAWGRFDALGSADAVVAKEDAANVGFWIFGIGIATGNNRLAFMQAWSAANARWIGTATLSTGTYYHLAVTYDKGSSLNDPIFYVDGAVDAAVEAVAPSGTSQSDAAGSLSVGTYFASTGVHGGPWGGHLEGVRVFNRVLSPQEVAVLAGGYRGPMGGEVLWLGMDGPNGNLTTGTANVFDMSGNGNHGTPQGGSSYVESYAPRVSGWIP